MSSNQEFGRRMTRAEHDIESVYDILGEIQTTLADHTEQIGEIQTTLADHTEQIGEIRTTQVEQGVKLDKLDLDVTEMKDNVAEILRRLPPAS